MLRDGGGVIGIESRLFTGIGSRFMTVDMSNEKLELRS